MFTLQQTVDYDQTSGVYLGPATHLDLEDLDYLSRCIKLFGQYSIAFVRPNRGFCILGSSLSSVVSIEPKPLCSGKTKNLEMKNDWEKPVLGLTKTLLFP